MPVGEWELARSSSTETKESWLKPNKKKRYPFRISLKGGLTEPAGPVGDEEPNRMR